MNKIDKIVGIDEIDKMSYESSNLIMLSGGIGSATLLAYLKKHGFRSLKAVFFYYNSCILKEKQSAEKLANYYGVDLKVVDLLKIYGDIIVKYPVNFQKVNDFYIPYRNGVMVSLAVALAYRLNYSNVIWGTSFSSFNYYSDCFPSFVKNQKSAVFFGTNSIINLITPFLEFSKSEIMCIGKDLNIPLELTWSCAVSKEKPCNKCFGCLERKELCISQ